MLASMSFFPWEYLAVIWWHFHSLCALVLQIEMNSAQQEVGLRQPPGDCLCVMWTAECCCTGSKLGKKQAISLLSPYLLLSTRSYMRALNRAVDDWMARDQSDISFPQGQLNVSLVALMWEVFLHGWRVLVCSKGTGDPSLPECILSVFLSPNRGRAESYLLLQLLTTRREAWSTR